MSPRDAWYRFQVISPYIGMDVNSSDTHIGFGLPLSLPKFGYFGRKSLNIKIQFLTYFCSIKKLNYLIRGDLVHEAVVYMFLSM